MNITNLARLRQPSLSNLVWMFLFGFALSSASAQPIIVSNQPPWDEVVWALNSEIASAATDGSRLRVILSDLGASLFYPEFSPNGLRLAFFRNDGQGPSQACVYTPPEISCIDAPGITYGPAWDPDNRTIYYAINQGDGQIWKIDFDLPDPAAEPFLDPPVYRTFGVSLSGDGSKMVMAHDPSNWTYFNFLSIYDFQTGQQTTILPNNGFRDFFPDYSPTRGEIVWGQGDAGCCGDKLDIWIIDDDGTEAVNLTPDTPSIQQQMPLFSPDGESVYFEQEGELWVMERDGSSKRMLFNLGASNTYYDIGSGFPAPFQDVVVLASNSVWLRQSSEVISGDVFVNQAGEGPFLASGMELTAGIGSTTPAEFELKADSIKLKSGSLAGGDVFYNELVNNGLILGVETSPIELPVFDVLPPFHQGTPGHAVILVGRNEVIVLDPGDYGDITVKQGGAISFTGGIYNVRSIEARDSAGLFFEATSEVRVAEKFETGQNSVVGPAVGSGIDASDIAFHVAGINGSTGNLAATPKAAKIGLNNIVDSNFYVPDGTLWLKQGTFARGAFFAKDVIVGIGVQVELDTSF